MFKRLASSGFAVHTFDAVGHGRSPAHPKRGRFNVQKFGELRDDAVAFATHVLDSRYGGSSSPPAFMMGCSLGGLIASYVVLADQAKWAKGGLVLMSAAMDVEWTFVLRVQAPMGALLAVLLPDAPLVPAVRAEDLSRNPAVVEAHKADTLVPHGNTKCRIGYEILQAFRNLQVRLSWCRDVEVAMPLSILRCTQPYPPFSHAQPQYKDLTVPILAMHGGADKITSMPAVRVASLPATMCHPLMHPCPHAPPQCRRAAW